MRSTTRHCFSFLSRLSPALTHILAPFFRMQVIHWPRSRHGIAMDFRNHTDPASVPAACPAAMDSRVRNKQRGRGWASRHGLGPRMGQRRGCASPAIDRPLPRHGAASLLPFVCHGLGLALPLPGGLAFSCAMDSGHVFALTRHSPRRGWASSLPGAPSRHGRWPVASRLAIGRWTVP